MINVVREIVFDVEQEMRPAEPLIPNAETITAMKEARRGGCRHSSAWGEQISGA